MKIVGVGCGPGLMTEEAIRAVAAARLIFGSDRAIAIAEPHIDGQAVVRTIDDFKSLNELPDEAVILSTGDPMLAGLGYLTGDVIPGISSLQVACARLRVPLARVAVVVAHGRGHEQGIRETVDWLRCGKIVFLLPDPKFPVSELYRQCGCIEPPPRVALLENLGYADEKIIVRDLSSRLLPGSDLYSLLIGNF